MPEISKELILFKDRIEEKCDRVKEEIAKLEYEIEQLKNQKNNRSIQSLTQDNHKIDNQIKRLQELLVIQRDYKKRLSTEVLRLGHRNPGLIQPGFKKH
jgi:DNA repair ATPase RecN